MNTEELIRTAVIAIIFFGIGAAAAESNLHTFTLRADKVLTDYIGGNATASEVNITGRVIRAGQVTGYYNESVTDALLEDKANVSELAGHTSNNSNPHSVTASQVGAAESSHSHGDSDLTSINWSKLSSVPTYASRWADWSEITNKPSTFVPSSHSHTDADIPNNITIDHATTAGNADTIGGQSVSDLLPAGIIVMWSDTLASIPSGWQLCDGTNGTPDLRERFVVGVNSSTNPGLKGGDISKTTSGVSSLNKPGGTVGNVAGEHTHNIADIRPPYYEIAFICKT